MRYLLTAALLLFFVLAVNAQTNKEKSVEFARKGIKLVDLKKFDEGISMFRQGLALDPQNSLFAYEIATAFYLQEKYDSVIATLEAIIDRPDVNDQFYQVLGNAWDMKKQPDKALQIYASGIKRFPLSGILCLESGIVMQARDSMQQAIKFWEKGVNADPALSSNYYYLAKTFAPSGNKVWALLYGEIFMNIERNSKRSEEMSSILYNVYSDLIDDMSDTAVTTRYADSGKTFSTCVVNVLRESLNTVVTANKGLTQTAKIYYLRKTFIDTWFLRSFSADFPNTLFNRHKVLMANGHFEAYTYWMLMKGNDQEFTVWYNQNSEKYKAFVAWFTKNPMKIGKEDFISRERY